jgi:hypothetical protein
MRFLENYIDQDSMEICFDYISNVVHFLETHAAKLGIEDELDKLRSILKLPHDIKNLVFLVLEVDALLESRSATGLEWIRDDRCFSDFESKAA